MKKESYEKDLNQVFGALEDKNLVKGISLMETLIIKLFKRDVVSFNSVKQIHRLSKAIEKLDKDKRTYLRLRQLYGDKYEEVIACDIGVFIVETLLTDSRVKEKIGTVDVETLSNYLDGCLYEETDYSYHSAILKMENTAVSSGKTMYLKKDIGSENRYTLYMEYEYQIGKKDENACIIEHGLTNELWSHEHSVYANFCDFFGYIRYRPVLGKKEIERGKKIISVSEDGTLFLFDAEGKLWVKKKYERESVVPELTKESKFEILDGERLLLHRRNLREGISETPVLQRLIWSRGAIEIKEHLLSSRKLKYYVWERLVKRIISVETADSILAVLTSTATPLRFPEPFQIDTVKKTLERLMLCWSSGTNIELDTVRGFVDALGSREFVTSEMLSYYLYSYIEFITEMEKLSSWEAEKTYKRASELKECYVDYQMKLSFMLNRSAKKTFWTEPEGYVGFFDYKDGEMVKDFVAFSDTIEVEVTMDCLRKRANIKQLPGELRFDRFQNKYVIQWKSREKSIVSMLKKVLGTQKVIEFQEKEKDGENTRWEMLHDVEFYDALKKRKI